MNLNIKYNKLRKVYIVKLNNKLLFNYYLKKNKKNKFSLLSYNYFILLKVLRVFGLMKPIYNNKDYLSQK